MADKNKLWTLMKQNLSMHDDLKYEDSHLNDRTFMPMMKATVGKESSMLHLLIAESQKQPLQIGDWFAHAVQTYCLNGRKAFVVVYVENDCVLIFDGSQVQDLRIMPLWTVSPILKTTDWDYPWREVEAAITGLTLGTYVPKQNEQQGGMF